MRVELRSASADTAIAALAGPEHGVVARRQLLERGVERHAVQRRIERGLLITIYRGVYAVGHANISREARWMAAVLASGRDAVLSHRAAGASWRVAAIGWSGVEVTVPRGAHRHPRIVRHTSTNAAFRARSSIAAFA